jgi:xylose isomerase
MRTYKILAARAAAFDADPDVQEILAASHADPDGLGDLIGSFDATKLARLESLELDPEALAQAGKGYERLDQLAMEHLMGVRG